MKLVILESPYAGNVRRNLRYARACLRDSLRRGECPLASHLLYTQEGVLDDNLPEERALGIEAGLAWGRVAEATVVYTDLGWSKGMLFGVERAREQGRPVEVRTLPSLDLSKVLDPCPLLTKVLGRLAGSLRGLGIPFDIP